MLHFLAERLPRDLPSPTQALLERKKGSKAEKGKGKFTEAEVQAMSQVD